MVPRCWLFRFIFEDWTILHVLLGFIHVCLPAILHTAELCTLVAEGFEQKTARSPTHLHPSLSSEYLQSDLSITFGALLLVSFLLLAMCFLILCHLLSVTLPVNCSIVKCPIYTVACSC